MSEYTRLLVQFSSVLNGTKDASQVDIAQELRHALAKDHIRDAEAQIEIDWQSLPVALGNHEMIQLLLAHLIDNCLKFARPREKPQIHVSASQNDSHWIVSVADQGIGIDEDLRQEVFAPFKKLHSHAEFGGCGIGLAICQKIVEAHQGSIWIESNQPHGTIIRFSLSKNLSCSLE